MDVTKVQRPFGLRWRGGIAGTFGIALACAVALLAPAHAPAADSKAPAFHVEDVHGNVLDLDTLRQRGPVLLDFWATWCKPCIKSLPELEAWHEQYGPRGLTVIGVSVDGPRNRARVRPFAKRLGLDYAIVVDEDGRLQELYKVLAIPTAVLIDSSGAIAKVRVAYRPGEGDEMEEAIRALLPSPDEPTGDAGKGESSPEERRQDP